MAKKTPFSDVSDPRRWMPGKQAAPGRPGAGGAESISDASASPEGEDFGGGDEKDHEATWREAGNYRPFHSSGTPRPHCDQPVGCPEGALGCGNRFTEKNTWPDLAKPSKYCFTLQTKAVAVICDLELLFLEGNGGKGPDKGATTKKATPWTSF